MVWQGVTNRVLMAGGSEADAGHPKLLARPTTAHQEGSGQMRGVVLCLLALVHSARLSCLRP